MIQQRETRPSPLALLVLALAALGIITICSKSSPLYPMNDWVDANTYFTIGRGMLAGKVPYRDLVDQKGPLLFTLHALAALISRDSFLGVWVLEIAASFAFLCLQYRTLRLFFDERVLVLMPLLAGALYSQRCFIHGDSAEELCLPLLAYALYAGSRAIADDNLPDTRTFFLIGLTSGCVLWMKYTLLGFYLGWYAVPLYMALRKGRLVQLARGTGMILLGVGASALPFVLYFGVNGAIGDWLQVYFYDNFVYYPGNMPGMEGGAPDHWRYALELYRGQMALLLPGLLWCAGTRRWRLLWQSLLTSVLLFLGVYAGGWVIGYCRFAFAPCYVFSFAFCWQFVPALSSLLARPAPQKGRGKKRTRGSEPPAPLRPVWLIALLSAAALALGLWWAGTRSVNTYLMGTDRSQLPPYQAAEVIRASGVEDPTLLNYGFLDGGFYLASGILPQERYFCKLNARIPGMQEELDDLLARGGVDFVVTRNRLLQLPHYRQVGEWSFWFEGYDWDYHLYQRTALLEVSES